MDPAEAVKISCLKIIDFRQLEPTQLLWKRESDTGFHVLNSGKSHSQIFEAFQFGFGCDTSVEQAGVVLILRQNAQNISFSHLKSADGQHTYSMKYDGIDADFREVNRVVYINELCQLNVFASTMSFMFGGDLQRVLPKNDHDLRHYLETHLMKKPNVLNDYDEVTEKMQAAFEQKKSIDSTAKVVEGLKKSIKGDAENRRLKSEAAVGQRDLKLLEGFGRAKRLEELSQNESNLRSHLDGASNVQPERVVEQLKDWNTKMGNHAVCQQAEEARKSCTSAQLSPSQIYAKKVESLEVQIKSMRIFHKMDERTLFGKFRATPLAYEWVAARAELKQAEIEQRTSEIAAKWDAEMLAHQNRKKNVVKESGNDLIGIESIDASPMSKQVKRMKEEIAALHGGTDYNAEPHTFRIPTLRAEELIRPYLDRLPALGTFTVKTPDLATHKLISKLLWADYDLTKRWIWIHSCDPKDKGPYPDLFPSTKKVEVPVSAKKVLSSKSPPMDAATGKLRKMAKKFEKKEYITGLKPLKVDNSQLKRDAEKVKQLSERVERLEEQLAAQYRINFGGLFQQIPQIDTSNPKVVLDWVKQWTELRHVVKLKPDLFEENIKGLEEHLKDCKKKVKRHDNVVAKIDALKELKREGEEIVSDVDSVATKLFGPSAVAANEALSNTLHQTIDGIKAQLSEMGLKFNPNDQAWAQAFYDHLAPENKPKSESGDDSFDIQEAVALKMDEIQKSFAVLQTKDSYAKYTPHELNKVKRDLMEQQRHMASEIIGLHSPLTSRSEAFAPQLTKLKDCFHGLMQYCRAKWAVHLELMAEISLEAPIRMMVDDPTLDRALINKTTLNHGIAAFILQLAINITIGSPFIIIDGLNGFIEPRLNDAIMLLLKQVIKKSCIQVILIKKDPQEEELGTCTHHAWSNEEGMVCVAETTDNVMGGDEETSGNEEQSRMSVRSTSPSNASFEPNNTN